MEKPQQVEVVVQVNPNVIRFVLILMFLTLGGVVGLSVELFRTGAF